MSNNIWEPLEHLKNAPDLITNFYHLHPMFKGVLKDL